MKLFDVSVAQIRSVDMAPDFNQPASNKIYGSIFRCAVYRFIKSGLARPEN